MPKQFQKTLQNYISKMKKPTKNFHLPTIKLTISTSRILRACKHPRTPSLSLDRRPVVEEIDHKPEVHQTSDAATLSDIDRFLFENFRSLYQKEYDEKKKDENNNENNDVVLFERPPRAFLDFPANFPGSNRFFFDRSASESLIDEARTSMTTTSPYMDPTLDTNIALDDSKRSTYEEENNNTKNSDDFITLLAYSPKPYDDFKKSMQEMIEARMHYHGKVDWEFMEELLFCYLDMNDKKSYKFILRAFVDLSVVLRENKVKFQEKSRNVQATSVRRKKIEF